jgi:hypothetical protein
MMSFKDYFAEGSSSGRYVKIKPSGHPAYIQKVDDETWRYSHRGINGFVRKGWNRMGGWGYVAGRFSASNGTPIEVPEVHQTHKTMNDAINHAHQHVAWHTEKGKK